MITVWGNNNVAQFYASYNTLNYTNPFAHGAANVSSCSGETLFLTTTNQDDGVDSLDNQVYIDKMSGQISNGVITQLSFTDVLVTASPNRQAPVVAVLAGVCQQERR